MFDKFDATQEWVYSQVKGITSRRRWHSPSARRQSCKMVNLETAETTATSAAMLKMPQVRSPAIPTHHPMSPHDGSPGRLSPCLPPAAQKHCASRARRRTLDRPGGLAVQTDCGSAGSGGLRGRRAECDLMLARAVPRGGPGLMSGIGRLVACECVSVRSYIRILYVAPPHRITRRVQGPRAAGVRSRNFARNEKS